jgi:Zn finger protein HypA/HybF involved in hydrogenase expression
MIQTMSDLLPVMTDSTDEPQQAPKVEKKAKTKTRCPKCLSIKRERYHRVKTREISGTTKDGRSYTRVTWRRTKCQSCGQNRVDIEYSQDAVPPGTP